MLLMSITLDTSHFEMSPAKDVAPIKMVLISAMLDTSHCPIRPYGLSEQFTSRVNFRQTEMALLSSALVCGENENSPAHEFGGMMITVINKMT